MSGSCARCLFDLIINLLRTERTKKYCIERLYILFHEVGGGGQAPDGRRGEGAGVLCCPPRAERGAAVAQLGTSTAAGGAGPQLGDGGGRVGVRVESCISAATVTVGIGVFSGHRSKRRGWRAWRDIHRRRRVQEAGRDIHRRRRVQEAGRDIHRRQRGT